MQRMNEFGSTLFEIALAIAIISLLVTAMVIGQNLTINSQVSRLERDFRSIQTAIYDSQGEVRYKHGDVRKISFNLQVADAAGNNSNANGIIDGNWNSTSGEYFQLWQYVRPAEIAQGSADKKPVTRAPLKLPGGVIAIAETREALIAGLKSSYAICAKNIAGQVATKLDVVMDDGNTASGSMRVTDSIGGAGFATDSIVNSSTYMVCLGV